MTNVTSLDAARSSPRKLARKLGKFCGHRHSILVCEEDRTVECGTCGAKLDPFDALATVMREWDKWEQSKARSEHDARRASDELAEVKRHLANAKAGLRRATR